MENTHSDRQNLCFMKHILVLCYITDLIEGLFLLFATESAESARFASIKKKKIIEDLPDGSVVETPCFHAGSMGSIPSWRSSIYHAVWKKKKR